MCVKKIISGTTNGTMAKLVLGLGFSLFARRYSGYHESRVPFKQTYCLKRTQLLLFSFPPGTEMFHFPGFASHGRYSMDLQFKTGGVSPFGHLRIKGYKPPPRSFSQVSRVLHSRPRPRHPPCTLMSLVRRPEYHNHPTRVWLLAQVTSNTEHHH